jgi:predicted nuclease of restriction endonuclease-like (RecB) superfamily
LDKLLKISPLLSIKISERTAHAASHRGWDCGRVGENQDVAMTLTTTFFEDIRGLIVTARDTVARGINLVQVHTNFEIGRRIVKQEQQGKGRAAYGQEVIRALAAKLTTEFGKGFSASNLAYMRSFYLAYQERTSIFQSVTGKLDSERTSQDGIDSFLPATEQPIPFTLSWTHYVFLLGIKNEQERRFYELESSAQNWKVRELKRQFDTSLYERLALSRDKASVRELAKEGQLVETARDILKEPPVLEFLGLNEQASYSESDLESAIISQIEQFLLELGKGFLFEARQKRFTYDGDHFFVDLVFYNRLLRCYVLIDLKIGKITHQDLGQMQMYVNYFDRMVKTKGENATIGIVLCKQKRTALVEITLPKDANIHAQEYQLYLPSKEELQRKLQEWAAEVGNE